VLQDEVFYPARDNLEEFVDELLSLLLGDVGLPSQPFPQLLRPREFVGQWLRRPAFLGQLLLLGV